MNEFLLLAFLFLVAGVIAVPVASRLGLGSVLGYLLAGIALSPLLAQLDVDVVSIQHFAEFGVVMLFLLSGLFYAITQRYQFLLERSELANDVVLSYLEVSDRTYRKLNAMEDLKSSRSMGLIERSIASALSPGMLTGASWRTWRDNWGLHGLSARPTDSRPPSCRNQSSTG